MLCSPGVFPAPAFVADKKSFHKSSTERFRENINIFMQKTYITILVHRFQNNYTTHLSADLLTQV